MATSQYATETLDTFGKPVSDFTSSIQSRRNALDAKQEGQTSDYLTRFRQAIMGQEALPHMYNRVGSELNLPNLQTSANQLNTTLANLPSTYSAATRGFDVNANQLDRIVSTKSAAMAPTVTSANNALASAQDQQSKLIAAEQANQEKQLLPFQTEQSFLSDKFARESTGFTADNQTELDGLIAKMNAGVTLSEGEKQRANELAKQELVYKAAVYSADKSLEGVKYAADKKSASDPLGIFG